MRDITIWGINVGKSSEAESLFLNKNLVALSFTNMTDLTYVGDREAFKARYQQSYPAVKATEAVMTAAQVYRFVHEIGEGDFIAFPAKQSRKIHLGQICGPYTYRPSVHEKFPHQRPVRWLKEFSRTQFSQGALFELGSAMTVFRIKAHSEEFRTALERRLASPDEKIAPSAAIASGEVEEQTRDFVMRQIAQSPKGSLEKIVSGLIQKMGFSIRSVANANDLIEMTAQKGFLGFEPPLVKVQLYTGKKVEEKDLIAFYATLGAQECGLVVTSESFSAGVWQFARGKNNLRLVDGAVLANLIFEHYDQLDVHQRQLFPLKKVFVPDVPELENAD